jgi:hypothetical protein
MQAVLLYLLIVISLLQFWWLVLFIAIAYFSIRYGAEWLLPLALVFDGYYGSFHTFPVLSVLALVWYLFIAVLRPRLLSVEMVS